MARTLLGRFGGDVNALAAFQSKSLAARTRLHEQTVIKWYGEQFKKGLRITMQGRLKTAGQLLRNAVANNLSRPVFKYKSKRTGRVTVDPKSRSKPGEFPRADTTNLYKHIFYDMRGPLEVIVGTPDYYGLVLETKMNRSFLRRTLNEMQSKLRMILTQGPGGGSGFGIQ